ncbi:hypothetical protein K4B79_20520 [Streptomyces lincolnensis]|uniref:IclR family transcriptional regulator domain-containing protein n=1 Tax=Streptomyces lincolnensis TaxID=1915 RepID=UPI001E408FAA|nr:IclR family transcriptional regulator C-terminal domain-containing protein [Streptomyces lincolnensis]MCD7440597.1 hypothetical protein [Streptomyces lincolnensis]
MQAPPADQHDWHALTHDLRRFTPSTITDGAELTAELKQIAETGPARQRDQLRADRGCLAVPIRHPATGIVVAGLALSGPPARVAQPNTEHGWHPYWPERRRRGRGPGWSRRR